VAWKLASDVFRIKELMFRRHYEFPELRCDSRLVNLEYISESGSVIFRLVNPKCITESKSIFQIDQYGTQV